MIARILLAASLLARLATPVAAVPPIFQRDNSCVATSTITVTATITAGAGNSPTKAPSSTTNDAEQGVRTVYVTSTLTVTATVRPPVASTAGQTTAAQANNAGQTIYLTVTVTSNSVSTVTETSTVVQTVTQNVAPAIASAGSDGNAAQAQAQAQTITRTVTSLVVSSRPGQQNALPTFQPYYGNFTATNSSNSSLALAASYRSPVPFLPSSASAAAAALASAAGVSSYTNTSTTTTGSNSTSSSTNATFASNGYENSLYFANWAIYGAGYQPQSLPASSVTRINYAFADISSDGTVVSSDPYADTQIHYAGDSWTRDTTNNAYGCVKQLYLLKKSNRNLKVILSIGGWTWSSKFSPVAADATMRQTFVDSTVKLVTDWGMDGVDIDWEFNAYAATSDDTTNFVLLLKELRAGFDAWSATNAPGYEFLITVASPAGPDVYGLLDLSGMDPYIDTWNLMSYDYTGSWSSASGHQANIYFNAQNQAATPYSTDEAVEAYMAAGISADKILLGMPLYGRSFESTTGLGRSYSGVGEGDPTLAAGQWRLKNLPRSGATEYFDSVALASYSLDTSTGELISYDNDESAAAKSDYVKAKGLGGAMFWEASDDRSGSAGLVTYMASQLGALDAAQNLLSFPTSQYDNIRSEMS